MIPPRCFSSTLLNGPATLYGNQPGIAQWNLARLARLLPLADDQDEAVAQAQEALDRFVDLFDDAYLRGLRRKLGCWR